MIRLPPRQLSLGAGALVAAACLGSLALACVAGLKLFELVGVNKDIEAYRQLAAPAGATSPAQSGRPLLKAPAKSLGPRLSETLNSQWGQLGMNVYGVETVARRPFGRGLQSWSVTVRARGSAASGAKALAWIKANREAVALESINAFPGEGAAGEWTFGMAVLVAPTEGAA